MSWIENYLALDGKQVNRQTIAALAKQTPTNTKEYLHLQKILEIFQTLEKGAVIKVVLEPSQVNRLAEMSFVPKTKRDRKTEPKFDENAPARGRLQLYWEKRGIKIFTKQPFQKRFPQNVIQNFWNPEYLMQYFKLKGFEFGNWASQQDRQNYCFAVGIGLFDLSEVTGISIQNMGFKGTLSIAIGARGSSKAAAHYEWLYNVINITRYSRDTVAMLKDAEIIKQKTETLNYSPGIKALAHEWGHALDYVIGRYLPPYSPLSRGRLVSSLYIDETEKARKLMEEILVKIYLSPDQKQLSPYIKRVEKAVGSDNDYWFRRNEIFARAFERYVQFKLKDRGLTNVYLTQTKYPREVYLTDNELRAILPLMDNLMITCNNILNKKNIQLHELQEEKKGPKKLQGITDGLKKETKIPTSNKVRLNGIVNSGAVARLTFDCWAFTGKWKELIGEPEKGFSCLIYGQPKNGKSYFAFKLAKFMANNLGRVLFIAKEEGAGQSIKAKLNETGATHPNLDFFFPTNIDSKTEVVLDQGQYDFVIVDSFTAMGWTEAYFNELKEKYPKTSFIIIVQVSQSGKPIGKNSIQHDQDVIVKIKDQQATSGGRFASCIYPILVSDFD